MSDKKKKKPASKLTDDYMSGLSGEGDTFITAPKAKLVKETKSLSFANRDIIEEKKKPEQTVANPKIEAPKPRTVVPKVIKKDPELAKNIQKVMEEVPRAELEKLINPTQEAKDKLVSMEFQSRDDMSDEEKRDFIEQINQRQPEPEIAEMNGALVWQWQKNRRSQIKNDLKKGS